MVLFNYATKELTAKVVYYGPGLCGKTTNLQFIHQNLPDTVKGKMLSLATKTDRTLFFDFLPLDLGEIRGMKTRVQLYTVPGQVFYNETRKLVLKGVDGVVFVADSQQDMLNANVESFKNLEENLKTHGLSLAEMPHVIQFNKRDLPKLASIEEINAAVNKYNAPFYESVATTGIGVKDTLNAITKLVLLHLTKKYGAGATAAHAAPAARQQPSAVPEPAAKAEPIARPQAAMADAVRATAEPAPTPTMASVPVSAAATVEAVPATTGGGGDEPPIQFGHDEEFPDEPAGPRFAETEIDDLVDEVQTDRAPMPEVPAEPSAHVDGLGEPTGVPESMETPEAPRPLHTQQTEITLTEVASDDDLFNDPYLEVARMAPGEEREIVIPVEVAHGEQVARRYRLSLKLQLEPID